MGKFLDRLLQRFHKEEKLQLVAITAPDGITHLVQVVHKDNHVSTACGLTAPYKVLLRLSKEQARLIPRTCETCFPA